MTGPCVAPDGCPLTGISSVALSFFSFNLVGLNLHYWDIFFFLAPTFCHLCKVSFGAGCGGWGTLTPWSPTGKDFLLSFGLLRRAMSLVPSYEMPPGLARCPQTRVTGRTPLDLPPVKHSLQPSQAPILQMRTPRPVSSGWDSHPGHRASSWV